MKTKNTTELISYQTPDGLMVRGVLYIPAEPNGYAVVCLHQLRLNRSSYENFASHLQERGFYVLVPDMRGHGESINITGATISFDSMTEDEFRKIPGMDVESAKQFLVAQYKIDPESIGIVGASIGANSALISCGRNPQTKFVVALSPGLDYRGIQPANDVSQIQKPTLIIASKNDTYSAASATELFQYIPTNNKQIRILEQGGHGTELFQNENIEQFVLDWIMEAIR